MKVESSYFLRLRRNILLTYFTTSLESLIFFIPIFDNFQHNHLGMSYAQMAMVVITYQLLTAILELPTGALADLIGRRLTVAIGYCLSGIALVMIGFLDSYLMLFLWTVFRGLGSALISGAQGALLFDSLKELGREEDYSKIQVNMSVLFQLGMVLSSVLGGIFFSIWVGLPYLATGIFLILSSLITLLMQEPTIDSEKFTIKSYIVQTINGVKETFKTQYNKNLTIFYTLVGGTSWAAQLYMNQIFATSIGYDSTQKGFLFGLIRFVNSIIILKILNLPKYIGNKNAFIFFPLLILISFLPGYIESIHIGTLMLFGTTLASTIRFVVLDKLVNEVVISKYRATSVSALNMYVSLVAVVILGISGFISDSYGIGFMYSIIGLFSLIILLPFGIRIRNSLK